MPLRILGGYTMGNHSRYCLSEHSPGTHYTHYSCLSTGLNAFAAPLMVGGTEFQTIAPLILTFAQRPGSQDLAAILSVLLGVTQVILLSLLTFNERRSNFRGVSKTQTKFKSKRLNIRSLIPLYIFWHIFCLLFIFYRL